MPEPGHINGALEPFDISLNGIQADQVKVYLELLERWNRKINLTSIQTDCERLSLHFGESFYLAKALEVRGTLLDVGSGAGFPGLALKILFPDVHAILLEPVGKKRAFLKEVCRSCDLTNVEVRPERIEDYVPGSGVPDVDVSTMRSVGNIALIVNRMLELLCPGGHLCIWTTRSSAPVMAANPGAIDWVSKLDVPLSTNRQIWVGRKPQAR